MNFLKDKLHPFYEQDYQPGIRVCNYIEPKENPIDLHSERPEKNNSSNYNIKYKISEYIKVIEEINELNKIYEKLEIKKQEIETELLNNPETYQIIEELNKAKNKIKKKIS